MQACGAPSKQLRAGGSNQQHQHAVDPGHSRGRWLERLRGERSRDGEVAQADDEAAG
jgi:hypothetical protein